ncbi:MAG: GlxA family transcriptional regulator [Chitinophagaceae bacterium]
MKHVSILVPRGMSSLTNIEGSYQLLSEVNSMMLEMGRDPIFDIKLVGLTRASKQRNGLFTVSPDFLIGEVLKTDLIIIPALFGQMPEAFAMNKDFLPWITQQYADGAEVASFCIGSFFLAQTGLLNGRKCATHWRFANEFRTMFPDAHLVDDRILTEDKGIYTSGGAYSYLNLLVYLVEKYAGRDVAVLTAKSFMIDIDRHSQSPFIIFNGQKEHDDTEIRKAQEFIEKNFTERISVDQLADMLALGRRSLERRFKKATSNTVIEYIQRVKMEAAKKSFETSRKNINEVMYDVGYSDMKAFRTIFRKTTGLSPVAYKNKYNKDAIVLA